MLTVLHQSDSMLAVVKPPGLSTTSPPGTDSLESKLRQQIGLGQTFLSAVHRLDRDVGGIVLVALSKKTARLLSQQFESRKVKKTYLAWLAGRVAGREGGREAEEDAEWVDAVRKLSDEARGEICDRDHPEAKLAQTLARTIRYDSENDRTLMSLHPVTGRMHQLRLQSAFRGHPIVGDRLYGPATQEPIATDIPIALLAQSIEFHDPRTGKLINITLPPDPLWC